MLSSPRAIIRQLERLYGEYGSDRLRCNGLDFRISDIGDTVVVYEEVPIMLTHLTSGIGVVSRMSIPITSISDDYCPHDIRRNRRSYKGESSKDAIAKKDDENLRDSQWAMDDMKQAAVDDVLSGRKQSFGPWSYRGR